MDYIKKVNRQGTIFGLVSFLLLIAVPFSISIYFDAWPNATQILKALGPTMSIYVPVQIIELITYIPILGYGASYISFVTGNISNMKAPVIMNTIENAGLSAMDDDAEIISTIAASVSSLVTISMLAIGVLLFLLTGLDEIISAPSLAPAFDNLLPALFGGLAVVFISQNWKIAIAPIIVMLAIFFIVGPKTYGHIGSVLVPIGAAVAIIVARIMYKKGWLDEDDEKKSSDIE